MRIVGPAEPDVWPRLSVPTPKPVQPPPDTLLAPPIEGDGHLPDRSPNSDGIEDLSVFAL